MASGRRACRKQRISLELDEEYFVPDDDATRPFSQDQLNDLVCVRLKMVKLLLGQQSGFPKLSWTLGCSNGRLLLDVEERRTCS